VSGKETDSVVSAKSAFTAVSAVTYATEMLGITAQTQFLLLDLREPEEYDLWRIKESINFPAPNIARDKVIPELYRFRNAPDKLIIIYMNDERQGTQYAQILAEKGYENVFLLSGGIEAFLEDFTELVEGKQVPIPKRKIEGKINSWLLPLQTMHIARVQLICYWVYGVLQAQQCSDRLDTVLRAACRFSVAQS
jgi:rhodanese-related sulfurtransferase